MGRRSHWWALCAAALVLAGLASAGTGARPSAVPVVPSLEPEKTEALWRSLVRRPRHLRAQEGCRPLRGVFYAATDWLRLATKLAATPSPCAAVLRHDPADRRQQDEPQAGRGCSHPRARTELPRAGRIPLDDLEQVDRRKRLDVVRRRGRDAAADGAGRLRHRGRRHVGRERVPLHGAQRRRRLPGRTRASSCAGCTRATARAPRAGLSSSSAWGSRRRTSPSTRRTSRTGSPTRRSGRT